ncbi:MAG: SDR family oxidoreductase [Eubacteriaceae bacterium]|nr:SDR family oxidoreductase [Eubacteriaceae bacterium]
MEHDLTGKVAVVVGGGQSPGEGLGNGRCMCLDFARHGATVVAAARHLDRAQATIDFIKEDCGKDDGMAYELDCVNREEVRGLFQTVKEKYGHVDIMVYNVGVTLDFDAKTNTATLEAVNRLLDVDLVGCVWSTLEYGEIRAAQEQGGAILNISSIASKQTGTGINIGYGFYALSKAGMNHWGELAASYYAPYGVRVNTLVLGQVASIMGQSGVEYLEGGIPSELATAIHNVSVPLKGGRQTVWETAHTATFLCSDEAKFVTGMDFVLDGGTTKMIGPDPEYTKIRAAKIYQEYQEKHAPKE